MDERGGLENRCGLCGHRGFESHPLRQKLRVCARNFVFKPQITQIGTEVNAKDAKEVTQRRRGNRDAEERRGAKDAKERKGRQG